MLPITRPPFFLMHSVRSVLDQTLADLELCIICDGAPPETVAMAHDLARIDDRIFVFSFEKGERHGEAYRDIVLKGADAEFVAQIGDDDLWYPDHLAVLAELLRTVDLAALLQVRLMPDGAVSPVPTFAALSDPAIRDKMLSKRWNFFGPSEAGYRLLAYRALPVGWSPAPLDLWTDLFMWRKFLRHPGLTYASRSAVTSLKFGSHDWRGIEPEELAGIIAREAVRLQDPVRRAEIVKSITADPAPRLPSFTQRACSPFATMWRGLQRLLR